MGGSWSMDFTQVWTSRPAGFTSPKITSASPLPSSWLDWVMCRMAGTCSFDQLMAKGKLDTSTRTRIRIGSPDQLHQVFLFGGDGFAGQWLHDRHWAHNFQPIPGRGSTDGSRCKRWPHHFPWPPPQPSRLYCWHAYRTFTLSPSALLIPSSTLTR